MIAAAALAVALAAGPQIESWINANRSAVARIRNKKERTTRERLFAQSVRELAALQAAPAPRTGENAARIAREILSNHRLYRFGHMQKPPPKTWWERLTGWTVARWRAILDALFRNVRLGAGASAAIGDILLAAAIFAFLISALRLAWHYGRRATPARPSTHGTGVPAPAALYARAQAAAQNGNYAESVTVIFAAAVCELQRRGLRAGVPGETVGELRRRVRRPEFDVLARVLTLAVYAGTAIGPADWERARGAFHELTQRAEANGAA